MAGYIRQLISKVSIGLAAGAAQQVGQRAASDWWQERKRRQANGEDDETLNQETMSVEDGKNFPPLKEVASKYWRRFQAKRESAAWLKKNEQERLANEEAHEETDDHEDHPEG
jgi:hypothetical protein